MADIYDEVNEELRADQMRTAVLRYGPLAIAAAILIVLGAAGWEIWKWRDAKQSAHDANRYFQALQLADAPDAASHQQAIDMFSRLAKKAGPGYRSLARLYAASLEANAGKLDDASALWDQQQADDGADPALRGLAGLLWAQHHLDKGDPNAVLAHLAPLREPGDPWHPLAEECAAMLDIRQGHVNQARKTLKHLVEDGTALPAIRQRANLLLEEIGS